MPKAPAMGKGNFKSKLDSFFKSKLGKSTAQGEEILGVEITNKEIRLAQISSNKANQWVLEKFFVHKVDLPDDAAVLENSERLGAELSIAMQKSKITTPNAAIAIPVTSAIIRVVTAPLMSDEELNKAIEIFKKARKKNPDDFRVHFELGNVLLIKNELEESLVSLNTAKKINPIDEQLKRMLGEAHYKLANSLLLENNISKAISSYKNALSNNPNQLRAANKLSIILATTKNIN